MAVFTLQIVTPDRLIYEGEAERLIVRGMTGDLCILAHHIDYATALVPGEASVLTAEGERFAACGTYGVGSTANSTESCSGGTATCTAQPVCSKCSAAYGSNLGHSWNYAEFDGR